MPHAGAASLPQVAPARAIRGLWPPPPHMPGPASTPLPRRERAARTCVRPPASAFHCCATALHLAHMTCCCCSIPPRPHGRRGSHTDGPHGTEWLRFEWRKEGCTYHARDATVFTGKRFVTSHVSKIHIMSNSKPLDYRPKVRLYNRYQGTSIGEVEFFF